MLQVLLSVAFASQAPQAEIRTTVPLVLAPVTVTGRDGKPVNNLNAEDFQVRENGVVVRHELEVTTQPIAVAICIQTNQHAGPALAKIPKIGSLFLPLIAGEGGKAAVITYSDTITVRRSLTSNAQLFAAAFQNLTPDGYGSRMLDAVAAGLDVLERAGAGYRRVLIVIGESKDRSSKASLESALAAVAKSNVTIYPVSFSVYLTAFTSKGDERFGKAPEKEKEDKRPKVVPQGGGMNLMTMLSELGRAGKQNTAEALAKATGGETLSFVRLKGLESMVQAVGEDLHRQYLLSFTPRPGAAGYRSMEVRVPSRGDVSIRTRPGFVMGE
ncbi:MAG: VWA domain-containing protein [Candidatus Solibacter usitatus]|nr:VWA domain-containing protein [Candidatus Solibacter usitatus]